MHTYKREHTNTLRHDHVLQARHDCAHDVVGSGSARRRRDRRLRMHFRHEQLSLRMLRASMGHHSWQSQTSVGAQTDAVQTPVDEYVAPAAAPYAATASPFPVTEYATPALVDTFTAPSPVTEDMAPAPAVTYAAPAPMMEYVAPATPETVNAYSVLSFVLSFVQSNQ